MTLPNAWTALQQKIVEQWLSTRGVPGDARDILVEWFQDVKEGISL